MASLLSTLEKRLAEDFARYHVHTQTLRFVAAVASTFAIQLATGTADVGWKAALAALFGIAVTTGRQVWPTLPWQLVTDHLHAGQAAEVAPRTGMAANRAEHPGTADGADIGHLISLLSQNQEPKKLHAPPSPPPWEG